MGQGLSGLNVMSLVTWGGGVGRLQIFVLCVPVQYSTVVLYWTEVNLLCTAII
jgi:hypothetical protein